MNERQIDKKRRALAQQRFNAERRQGIERVLAARGHAGPSPEEKRREKLFKAWRQNRLTFCEYTDLLCKEATNG